MDPAEVFIEGLMEDKTAALKATPTPEKEKKETARTTRPPTSRSIFSHPEAHPVALDMVLLKNFELEWLTWLPDTLFHEIEHTFKTSIADVNRVKILAAQTLHVTDAFWHQWEVFEKTIWALIGIPPRLGIMQPPDLSILMAGVDIADSIRKEKYEDEIARYCAAVFMHEHVHYAPEPLDFCQLHLSSPYYICGDCHKKGPAIDLFDGLCSSCAGHYDSEHPFKFEPDHEAIKRGAGKNVKIHLTFDPEPVKKRFEELNKLSADVLSKTIRETDVDIQAAKLIIAKDYMRHKEQQLAEQLTTLRAWLEAP